LLLPQLAFSLTVVVNARNPTSRISSIELKRIFLGKKTLWSESGRIRPAMLSIKDPLSAELFKLFNLTGMQFKKYWRQRLFSGGGVPPKRFKQVSDLIEYLESETGAIGVLSTAPKSSKLKVIEHSH